MIAVIEINSYAYVVPYVEEDDYLFLKTIFPSRKYTKEYLREEKKMDPFKPLDKEEKDLMESIEKDEWTSLEGPEKEEEIKKLRQAARNTFTKSERMNIRISPKDLQDLKIKALQEGIPYQTLVSSIIHKYLNERLVEKDR